MLRRLPAAVTLVAVITLLHPLSAPAQVCGTTTTVGCLTAADVTNAVQGAVTAISPDTMVVAVVDRAGTPLAVFRKAGAPATVIGNFGAVVDANDQAVGLARTGAFFSNDQAPLSSRTVRFISGIHFPPGVTNKPPAALYGIENTNRGCSLGALDAVVPRATNLAGGACTGGAGNQAGCGTGIVTGKADIFDSNPAAVDGGGVPIFKDGRVAGGIGVTGVTREAAEFAALAGSVAGGPNFGPKLFFPNAVILDGIRLPFVNNTVRPAGVGPGVMTGGFTVGPVASAFEQVPSGFLVGPTADAGGFLTVANVTAIVGRAVAQAQRTRAAIRLPLGSPTAMVIAVAGLDGTLLAVFRMPDATVFSIDVAATKARNVVYFSGAARNPGDMPGFPIGFSMTARTIGFGAMPLYPAGIDGTRPGPFFGDFRRDVLNPCSQGQDPTNPGNQSGIVFFPGSIGIYAGGRLVGGLGVSGDGVEQDDLVTAAGVTPDFVSPPSIRADRVIIGGVRLPYFKFPRNPEIR